MDLLRQTKEFCNSAGIKPARSKGQNFLISKSIYSKIIKEAELKDSDQVLEVGPGLGFMTMELSPKIERLVAVELDDRLAEILESRLKELGLDNVELVNQDVLEFDSCSKFNSTDYKVVANLPYNISSAFLRKMLSSEKGPELSVLLLQKEVAERIIARPPEMSLLALSVQYYTEAFFIKKVSAGNFWPKPKVDSAIVKLRKKSALPLDRAEEESFFKLLRLGFSSKRKMLKNNLLKNSNLSSKDVDGILGKAGLNSKIRPQELSLSDWIKLYKLKKNYEKA